MTEKKYYVLFSDSKKSEKVSRSEFLDVFFVAHCLDAILREDQYRSCTILSVAFSRYLYDQYYLSIL